MIDSITITSVRQYIPEIVEHVTASKEDAGRVGDILALQRVTRVPRALGQTIIRVNL